RIVHAALEEAPERLPEIAVGGEVVGHRRQEIVGVEVVDPLRAVPARVADAHCQTRRGAPPPFRTSPLGIGCAGKARARSGTPSGWRLIMGVMPGYSDRPPRSDPVAGVARLRVLVELLVQVEA